MRLMLVSGVKGPKVGGVSFLLGWRRVQVSLGKVLQIKTGSGESRSFGGGGGDGTGLRQLRWDIKDVLPCWKCWPSRWVAL